MANTMSPTQRTLAWLRSEGLIVGIVERWLPIPGMPGGGKRSDFLNIIDVIALGADGVVGVQSCGAGFSAHKKKICEEYADNARAWLETPGTSLRLIGWTKKKRKLAKGGWSKGSYWTPRDEQIAMEDLK